jgi:hypothetical protein
MKKGHIRYGIFCAVIAIILSAFINGRGQEFRGSITGSITDPNGAAVPGATVIVKNLETNVSNSVTTNDDGSYTVPFLLPGKYSVTASGGGFKTSVRENIEVQVDDRLTIDFQLEIGTAAEVNIIADTELLERGSVTTGTVVTQRQIEELPLAEGAAYNLATQAPGVSYTGNPNFTGPTANGNLAAFRTNGASGNQITLDGSPNATFDGGVAYTPPADAVSQFKIQTNAFDAQNGFTAGSTVNVAIKSGTNDLHGSAYYFDRSKALTANNFFSNRIGEPRPDRKYYRYGGQVNGPVYLPWLYNGRDRTFFMFSYEKQYNKRPEPEIFTVPTALMRTGNFSEIPGTVIYDPADTFLANTTCTAGSTGTTVCRRPFANNIIPAARLNPAAVRFLNLYPLPNQPGIANNYFSNQVNVQPYDSYLGRLDHNFNESHRIFGKFFYSKSAEDRYNWVDTPDAFTRGNELRVNKGGSVDYTATLSSNFVLDIRSSLNDFVQERLPLNPISAADLGFTGIAAISTSTMLPRFDFTNFDTLGPERSDFNEGLTRNFRLFSLQPTLTQIFGNHTLKYGYDYRRLQESRVTNGYNAGRFLFDGLYTSPASNSNAATRNAVGRDLAAFLLGIPSASGGSIIENAASYDVSSDYHGFFIQDDWRVNQKLTLNLGFRYEIETGLREAEGRFITGFDPTAANPLQAAALANYNANRPTEVPITAFQNLSGGLTFAESAGARNQSTDKNNFQPRVGVSYALDDKTVLRGGFGIFSSPFQIQIPDQRGFTASTSYTASTDNGRTFLATINNPFPNGLNPAVGSGLGLRTSVGDTLGATNASGPTGAILSYERKNANYARFVVGIQRQLPWEIGVEATFVYSRGYDLPVLRQLNYVPAQYLNNLAGVNDYNVINDRINAVNTFLTATVPNPFRTLVPTNQTYNAPNIARRLLLTQYPQFQDLIVTDYNGTSDYRAIQLQATKRFSKGLSLNGSYSYNHDREKVRRLNPQDEELTDMLSVASRPHRFTFSGIYELPIGRDRLIGKGWNRWVDALIGGWQVQALYEWQSGEPLVLPNAYYGGNINELENRLGEKDEQGRRYGIDIPAFDIENFILINPATGARVAPGFGNNYTIGSQNTLRYLPYTLDTFRNQPFQKFDAGLTKNFRIREGMKLQVRIEAINAFNWVYFSGLNLTPSNGTNANPELRTFGRATTQRNLPRDIQLGARFTF